MLIFHWQLPFKCQFTSSCWEPAFVSLIRSQRGKVWGLTVLWAGWDRAAAESGRSQPTRMVRVKCTGKGLCTWGHQQPQLGAVAAKGNLFLALSGGSYDLVDNFRLFGMAGSIEARHWVLKGDIFKCLGTEKEDKNLFNRKTRGSVEKEALSTRHLHIFKIFPNKVHNEFNSVPYGPEEFSE